MLSFYDSCAASRAHRACLTRRKATDTLHYREPALCRSQSTHPGSWSTAPAPEAPAGRAGDKWSVPAKAKSDDDLAAADTFDLIAVGAAALPVADTVSLGDVNCTGLLTSARYILDGNRNYLWAYTRDRGTQTNPRCAGGVLREDEDGGYSLTADSIEFLPFDDGQGYRTGAGRIVRDTLEVRRGARLEHYVRVGRRGSRASEAREHL